MQLSPTATSTFSTVRTVFQSEGAFAFLKGNVAATYLWVTYAAVQFGVYRGVQGWLQDCEPEKYFPYHPLSPSTIAFVAGASAGLTATLATYPFDYMRTAFASNNKSGGRSMVKFVTGTLKTKGIGGFYAGVVPACYSIVPLMGLNFMAYDVLMGYLNNNEMKSSAFLAGTVGAVSGGVSKLSVYPMDTVKKRLQKQAFTQTSSAVSSVAAVRTSALQCGLGIVKNEGARALYRGLGPTIVKSMAGTGLTFAFYNVTRGALVEAHNNGYLGFKSTAHEDSLGM